MTDTAAPAAVAETDRAALRHAPGPRAVLALLRSLGPDAAAAVTRADVAAGLDGSAADLLDEHGLGPWAPAVAALTDDPALLNRVARTVLADSDALGWLQQPTLAGRVAANPATPARVRYHVAGRLNPLARATRGHRCSPRRNTSCARGVREEATETTTPTDPRELPVARRTGG